VWSRLNRRLPVKGIEEIGTSNRYRVLAGDQANRV
jgi:hypothetical protein